MNLGLIFNTYLAFAQDSIEREKQMTKHFEEKAEEARKKYWDACKYPRKTKKRMRKEAAQDYYLYKELAKPLSGQLKYTF